MTDRAQILFVCSKEFKDAVDLYAGQHNTDVAKIIRQAVANVIGYDLSKDIVQLGRKKKYNTPEEAAQAKRDKKITERALLEMYEHDEHLRAVVALQRSLDRKKS